MKYSSLLYRQGLPLEIKEEYSKSRIRNWYNYWQGNVYVAYSGGKDSNVLLHLVRSIYPKIPGVFIDTGLEFPEIREFVSEQENITVIKGKKSFYQVIQDYGYPLISKEISQRIHAIKTTKSEKNRSVKMKKLSKKWYFLLDASFKISDRCCYLLKKYPSYKYEKDTHAVPYTGMMAQESALRLQQYLKSGCNTLFAKRPKSNPIAFWTDKDIWDYHNKYSLQYSKIYDMGYKRTGCMFCMFGIHMEKSPNRFQRMKETHPQLYKYCMEKLELNKVLDYIHTHNSPAIQK